MLRTGSANFSASGLKRQVNDLLLTDDRRLVDAFTRTFERARDERQRDIGASWSRDRSGAGPEE